MGLPKEEAIDLIRRMPDEATTEDILDEIYFKAQVERGLQDLAEGRTLTHQELRERMARWRNSTGR